MASEIAFIDMSRRACFDIITSELTNHVSPSVCRKSSEIGGYFIGKSMSHITTTAATVNLLTYQFLERHQSIMTSIMVYLIPLYFLSHSVGSKILQNDSNWSFTADTYQLAKRYLATVEPLSYIYVIIDRQARSSVSSTILNAYKLHPLILKDLSEKCTQHNGPSSYMKIHYIVGIYKTPQYVEPSQWQIFFNTTWNSRASIAIWITSPTTPQDLLPLFTRFWIYNSVNVIAIAFHAIENRTNVYSYDPFRIKNDGSRGEIFQVPKKGPLFPEKLKNLHGYQIPISLYHQQPHARLNHFTQLSKSMDVNYCQFLAHFMNFTIALKTAKVGLAEYIVHLTNGFQVGVIGDILINSSHLIGNSMYWEVSDLYSVDVVYPYWRSEILVAIPQADPTSSILRLIKSHLGQTLVLIASALTVLFIFLHIRRDKHPFLKTLTLFLFQNFGKIGSRSSERIFVISWIYWSFLLVTMFQTQLIDDLSAPPFYDNIETIVEFDRSNSTLLARRWEYNAVNHSYVNHKRKLIRNMVIEVNGTKCMMWLVQYRNVACTVDRSYADYETSEIARALYKREIGNESKASWKVHFIKEPLIKFWKTYAVKKSSPYLEKINEATSRLVEMGIMQKWEDDDTFRDSKMSQSLNKFAHLTLHNMDKVFLLLICGHFFATVIFILEVIFDQVHSQYTSMEKNKKWARRRGKRKIGFINHLPQPRL